jgi:hypothetical protein
LREVRIQSDGTGKNTVVTLEDGKQLYPTSAVIYLESREANQVELTFHGEELDVHAEVSETKMMCPLCSHEATHYCPEAKTL